MNNKLLDKLLDNTSIVLVLLFIAIVLITWFVVIKIPFHIFNKLHNKVKQNVIRTNSD